MLYVGRKRSTRSKRAISHYEMPLALVDKAVMHKVIDDLEIYDNEALNKLHNLTLQEFKYFCRVVGATSWHHTGATYLETEHYDLKLVFKAILKNGIDKSIQDYENYKKEASKNGKF